MCFTVCCYLIFTTYNQYSVVIYKCQVMLFIFYNKNDEERQKKPPRKTGGFIKNLDGRRIHHIRFPFGSAGCLSCSSNFIILLQRKKDFATKLILSDLPHIPNYFYKYPSADSMEPAILNFSHSSGNFFAVSFMQSTNSLLFVFSTISSQTSLIQEN